MNRDANCFFLLSSTRLYVIWYSNSRLINVYNWIELINMFSSLSDHNYFPIIGNCRYFLFSFIIKIYDQIFSAFSVFVVLILISILVLIFIFISILMLILIVMVVITSHFPVKAKEDSERHFGNTFLRLSHQYRVQVSDYYAIMSCAVLLFFV